MWRVCCPGEMRAGSISTLEFSTLLKMDSNSDCPRKTLLDLDLRCLLGKNEIRVKLNSGSLELMEGWAKARLEFMCQTTIRKPQRSETGCG